FLEHVTARDDDVVAAAIKLDDAEFERLAFQVSGIAHRADVDQRAWQERADAAHVDGVATLDLAADLANDGFAVFIGFGKIVPGAYALGRVLGLAGGVNTILDCLQRPFDPVSFCNRLLAVFIKVLLYQD